MKKFISAALLTAVFLLTGCSGSTVFSDFREVEELEVIRTIGIDIADDGVTVIAGTGTETGEDAPGVYKYTAPTVSGALSRLQTTPGGKFMFFAHTEHILIGENAARRGIQPALDFIERTTEMRLDTDVFIVKNGTAEDVMASCAGARSSATDVLRFLHEDIKNLGEGYVFNCEDVSAALADSGCALVMAVEKRETESLTEEGSMVAPAGFAVVDGGKLAGYLTDEETRGAALLLGKVDFESVPVRLPEGTVSLGINKEKISLFPVFQGDTAERIDIFAQVEANVEEVAGNVRVSDEAVRAELEKELARIEASRIAAAVKKSQKTGLDFLSTGAMALRREPVRFAAAAGDWAEIFPDMQYKITVTAAVRGTYDVDDPVPAMGEEKGK